MRARDFLARGRHVDREIEAIEAERRRLYEQLTRGVGNMSGMPRGGTRDWADAAARLADLDAELARMVGRLVMVKRELWNVIDLVEDPELRVLLELRYAEKLTWRQVARRMNYDERSVYRLYKKALKVVDEILLGD